MGAIDLPPLAWLRAFEAAARHLSFTQAAEELHLTQSAVSQHVRALESRLARQLFIRRTRALQLTEAGANYLPVVQEAFATLSAGTRAFTGGDRGRRLMVTCNLAFATFWLAPRLADLLQEHPWLTLNITTPIWDPERAAGQPDVEIRFGRVATMPPTAHRMAEERAYPVCSPSLPGSLRHWEQGPLFDCAGVLTNWEAWLAEQGYALPRGKSVNLASTYVVALTAAITGAGISMAHDTLAGLLLAEGTLIQPFERTIRMPEGYFLLNPPKHAETPATRAFTDWIGRIAR